MLFVTGCSTDSPQNSESDSTVSAPQADVTDDTDGAKIITISELCGLDEDTVEKTDFSLIYTLYDEASDGEVLEISDESAVSDIFALILDIKVNNQGEYVDMYVMRYEDYLFNSDSETFSFSFVPDSYFCYNGLYYEIVDSNLNRNHNIIEECRISENTDSCWFSDDAVFDAVFHDNGDEALSVTEIVISCEDNEVRGYIEGAYEILSVNREPDCYLVTYTYGDFYSHDKQCQSRITIENGEMIIEDLG